MTLFVRSLSKDEEAEEDDANKSADQLLLLPFFFMTAAHFFCLKSHGTLAMIIRVAYGNIRRFKSWTKTSLDSLFQT